jgi:hypothetical protein
MKRQVWIDVGRPEDPETQEKIREMEQKGLQHYKTELQNGSGRYVAIFIKTQESDYRKLP